MDVQEDGGNCTRFNEDVQLHFCLKANRGCLFFFAGFGRVHTQRQLAAIPEYKRCPNFCLERTLHSFLSWSEWIYWTVSYVWGERSLFTTFPCESLQTHSSVNTFDTFSKEKLLLISTAEGMFGQFITKIPPYNLHGTMAYHTPLYTSYICCQTFKTV